MHSILYTGCSLNSVFSEYFKIFRTLAFPCFPSVSVCVYTHQAGRTTALQQNWQSSENHNILRKNTIFNEHPVVKKDFWAIAS